MLRKVILGNLFLGAALLLFFSLPQTAPFSPSALVKSTQNLWSLHPTPPETLDQIHSILSQKFILRSGGAQVHVFFSEDGTSVLKLLKKERFEVPSWIRWMPPNPYRARKLASKRAKVVREFSSYQIAFDELEKETALLLVHLDKQFDREVTLIDENNLPHTINLGDYAFILQKKGELVYPHLEHLVKAGDMAGAKAALGSLLSLLKERCDKGIADSHPNFGKNFAFLDGGAIEIDIGRFSRQESVEVPRISKKFMTWLEDLSPELHEFFNSELAELF